VLSQESKYFEEYQGYVSTQMGEQADMEELWALQIQINNAVALN
jgi:hypothetical protein